MGKEKTREQWVDFIRGWAILCVILGHCAAPDNLTDFVFSFHMPIFFVLSGYFLRPAPMKELAVKRARQLMIPYLTACFFIVVSDLVHYASDIHGEKQALTRIMHWLWAAFYGSGMTYTEPTYINRIGALWFLPALWFATLIVNYALTRKDEWKGILFILVTAAAGYVTGQIIWLPFSVQAGMVAAVYVYCGTLARRYALIEKFRRIPACFAATALVWVWYLWCGGGKLYMVWNYFGQGAIDLLGSLCACMTLCVIGQIAAEYTGAVLKPLEWLGRNSLTVLCIHIVEANTFRWGELPFLDVWWKLFLAKTLFCIIGVLVINTIKSCFKKRNQREISAEYAVSGTVRERLCWLDMASGAVILLMILGHLGVDEKLRSIIFSFHIPFFFVVSGFLFKEDTPLPVLLRKLIRNLVLPYLGVEICAWFIRVWKLEFYGGIDVQAALDATMEEIRSALLGMSYSSTILQNVGSVGPVWFVICLFWSMLVFALIHRLLGRRSAIAEAVVICLCCVAGVVIGKEVAYLPYSFDVSLVGVAFIYIGYLTRRYALLDKLTSWAYCVPMAAIWVLGIWLGNIELAVRSYPYFPLCILAGAAGSLIVMGVCRALYQKSIFTDFLCLFGAESMLVLGIHRLELGYVGWSAILEGCAVWQMWLIKIILIGSVVILAKAGCGALKERHTRVNVNSNFKG